MMLTIEEDQAISEKIWKKGILVSLSHISCLRGRISASISEKRSTRYTKVGGIVECYEDQSRVSGSLQMCLSPKKTDLDTISTFRTREEGTIFLNK